MKKAHTATANTDGKAAATAKDTTTTTATATAKIAWKGDDATFAMMETVLLGSRFPVCLDGTTVVATNGKQLLAIPDAVTAPGHGAYTIARKGNEITFEADTEKGMTLKYKDAMPDTADWHCCRLDFDESRPLYPELFKMMAALAKSGGWRAGDKTVDMVIDTFGKFDMYYTSDPKKVLVFKAKAGYTLIAAPCRGMEEAVRQEIVLLTAAATAKAETTATAKAAASDEKAAAASDEKAAAASDEKAAAPAKAKKKAPAKAKAA